MPKDLHPVLQKRLDDAKTDTDWFNSRRKRGDGENAPFIDGDMKSFGNHAEVWAVNDALKDRVAKNLPVTEATLDNLLMDVRRTKEFTGPGGGTVGSHFKRCADCSRLTSGVDLTDALRNAETSHGH